MSSPSAAATAATPMVQLWRRRSKRAAATLAGAGPRSLFFEGRKTNGGSKRQKKKESRGPRAVECARARASRCRERGLLLWQGVVVLGGCAAALLEGVEGERAGALLSPLIIIIIIIINHRPLLPSTTRDG